MIPPAALPAGWTPLDSFESVTGTHYTALAPTGIYRDSPRRIRQWTCPAGVRHVRYWRRDHRPRRPIFVACEHFPDGLMIGRSR